MKKKDVTLMVLADFSKAFDTVCFKNVIRKLSRLGFSKPGLFGSATIYLIANITPRLMTGNHLQFVLSLEFLNLRPDAI
jgi:hypothetical protein